MTGRGRGRLLRDWKNDADSYNVSLPANAADIKDLFSGQRSPTEVYKILKANILDAPFSTNKLRSNLETIISNMIQDSTNTIEICKYLYVCSCSTNRTIGQEVWSQFFKILEGKFKVIYGQTDQINEDTLHNFVKFFIVAIHFMRDPMQAPQVDIISAILVLISRLKKSVNDDRNLYCLAVAWTSSYLNSLDSGTILSQAFYESLSQVREWIMDGTGGHWALACLEAACNGGHLPPSSRGFYSKTLSRLQFFKLNQTSANILIPISDKSKYNLPNLDCINYID